MIRLIIGLLSCLLLSACETKPTRPSPVSDTPRSLGWSYMGSDASWESTGAYGSGFPTSR